MSACRTNKIDVLVTCTYRSPEEQAELYAQGRTKPGRIVTYAKPGESKHNIQSSNGAPASKAFDVVPLRHGKLVWGTSGNGLDDDPTDDDTDDLELWERIGAIGEQCGLSWAGRLAANDVVRVHNDGTTFGSDTRTAFVIRKVGT